MLHVSDMSDQVENGRIDRSAASSVATSGVRSSGQMGAEKSDLRQRLDSLAVAPMSSMLCPTKNQYTVPDRKCKYTRGKTRSFACAFPSI